MKRRSFLHTLAYGSLAASTAHAIPPVVFRDDQTTDGDVTGPGRFGDERDWFFSKRFGLFIHWGLYAIPGWHEQHHYRTGIPRKEYAKLMHEFNPVNFDPDAWIDLMEIAGMEYICFTTKHIDGFCMWDTSQTGFKITNTPYRRDTLAMLAEACHRRKIPLCLYYSVVDSNHPAYPNQGRAHEFPGPEEGDRPDQEEYLRFLREQVYELCTGYGEIHGFWWDANRLGVTDPSINQMIRRLQPKAVINNRGFDEGDFSTPERDFEKDEHRSFDRPTEACQAVGIESWGYRTNEDYYTDRHLIRSIDRYLSRDANYLLNIGPDPLGVIPERSRHILGNIGKWYHPVKESFVNVEPLNALTSNKNVMLTGRGTTLYVHLNSEPEGDVVKLRPFTFAPKSAVLLNTGRKVEFELEPAPQDFRSGMGYLRLKNLPANELCNTVMVIKLEFDRPPAEYLQGSAPVNVIREDQK
jgi:alpha-L-fucosidase